MSEPGEMSKITAIARPQIAIMTNIGVSHIENLGSQENIMREKLHITDAFTEDGILIVNGDDALLKGLKGSLPFTVITYGFADDCDIRAKGFAATDEGSSFIVTFPHELPVITRKSDGSLFAINRPCEYADGLKVSLKIPGRHMAGNALAALAACAVNGICLAGAAQALSGFSGFNRRLEIIRGERFTIIDDAYNASPDSMKASLEVLSSMPASGKKIAVLADMLELGENAPLYHRQVGEFINTLSVSQVVTIGELAKNISDEVAAGPRAGESAGDGACASGAAIGAVHFAGNADALEYLTNIISEGDIVLFKGSNGMKLSEIVAPIKEKIS